LREGERENTREKRSTQIIIFEETAGFDNPILVSLREARE
jgi:hypothetical protein